MMPQSQGTKRAPFPANRKESNDAGSIPVMKWGPARTDPYF
jgi:hypothetical protein